MRKLWLVVVLLWTAMATVSAQTFTATVSLADQAEVKTNGALVVGTKIWVGDVGLTPAGSFGKFSSYSASGGLPTITGGDLDKYGWAMEATVTYVDISNKTAKYAGTFYLLAPGYGFDDVNTEYLEKATFSSLTAVWNNTWREAMVTGYMYGETGDRQPTNESSVTWPVPVDWSAANPGYFSGVFLTDPDPNTSRSGWLYGTLSAPIPDASTVVLFGSGLLPVLAVFRRRK